MAGVGATVLACIATHKRTSEFLAEAEARTSRIETYVEEEDQFKAKAVLGMWFVASIAKIYGPSVGVGVLSAGMLVASNRILNKRGAAIAGALAVTTTAFSKYRGRVKDELGADVDTYLMYKTPIEGGMKIVPADKKVNPINFEEVALSGEIYDPDEDRMGMPSPYARWFDESSVNWRRDANLNSFFLNVAQAQANDMLKIRGHLFLNEVYDILGIPRSDAGAITGWVDDGEGDGVVDFDIFNPANEINRQFVNGFEDKVLLDFNVDGAMWYKI